MPSSSPFTHFVRNRELLLIAESVLPLTQLEVTYGFGVYESVRVISSKPWFLRQHIDRLFSSAAIIALQHEYSYDDIARSVALLLPTVALQAYNVKLLLIGGRSAQDAMLFVLASSPVFPDKRWYKTGVCVTQMQYERYLPQAKSLSMLGSYLAYRKAKNQKCYDCLLVNRHGAITEGTRTNFFAMRGTQLISASENDILPGITRELVLHVAKAHGYSLQYERVTLENLKEFDGAFLTSTSSKILPIRAIDDTTLAISDPCIRLIKAFDTFLKESNGDFEG